MADEKENVQPDEEQEQQSSDDDTSEEEQGSEQQPEEQDAEYWKNRALKAENAVVKNKKKEKQEKQAPEQITSNQSDTEERIERIEMKAEGWSEDQIEFLMKVGGKAALKDENVKNYAQTIGKQQEAEEAVPESHDKSGTSQQISNEEWKQMSWEEKRKYL